MRGGGRSGFTLVEIMIVVAIIAILAAIAIPQLIESRKMSRLNKCMNNMKIIYYAYNQAALNVGAASGESLTDDQWVPFLKDGIPECPSGGGYMGGEVNVDVSCTYHGSISSPSALSALTSD